MDLLMPQLSDEQLAWCMREFLRGEKPTKIGARVGMSWRTLTRALMDFYERHGSHGPDFVHIENYRERQVAYYRQALARYQCGGKIAEPPMRRGKVRLRKGTDHVGEHVSDGAQARPDGQGAASAD